MTGQWHPARDICDWLVIAYKGELRRPGGLPVQKKPGQDEGMDIVGRKCPIEKNARRIKACVMDTRQSYKA